MGYVRCIDRSAVVGFCPTAPYYLAGSAASAIDLNFSTTSVLEVFKVDFTSAPPDLPIAGAPVTVGERFHSVCWGKTGIETKLHPLGLVAGGLEDGSVSLWDPNRIIQGAESSRCVVAKLKKHNNAVRALDFNPNSTQLLATGSVEPDLLVWDLTKPSIPVQLSTPSLTAPTGGVESDFTCTKWNEKVHQILASCTTGGKTIVQDIRRAKPVATLHDLNSSRRCSVLEWSPERPTQVLVASEDDRTPTVQVWDLRNSASALSELSGHSKGILSMSWSPHDPRLLLTCAKDSKTYCWNVQTSQIVGELPALGAWHLYVKWSPLTPGLFSVSSFDGKIGICSFSSMIGPLSADQVNREPITVVPRWLPRPAGLSCGFGGKLVHVSQSEKATQDPSTGTITKTKTSKIHVKSLDLETETVPHSEAFEEAMKSGDREKIVNYCKTKTEKSKEKEQEIWKILGLMFSDDAKHQLLTHLGFADVVDLLKTEPVVENGSGEQPFPAVEEPYHQDSGLNAALDFFDNLGEDVSSPKAESKPAIPEPKPVVKVETKAGVNETEIQKALLVKNFDGAIEYCWKANRSADALIIAHVAGEAIFQREMNKYMSQHPCPFMPLVSAIAGNDFEKLIQTRDPSQWKETLAMLVAYVDDTETWSRLCDSLGVNLYKAKDFHGASICFICSGNVEKAVGVWSTDQLSTLQRMQEVIEKAFVLGYAAPQQSASQSLSNIVHNYAQILASQGSTQTALEYLDMVPGEPSENIQILKDRIYGSGLAGEVSPSPAQQPVQGMIGSTWSPSDSTFPSQTASVPTQHYGEQTGYGYYQQEQPPQYQESYHEQNYPQPPPPPVQQFNPAATMFTPQVPDYGKPQSNEGMMYHQPVEQTSMATPGFMNRPPPPPPSSQQSFVPAPPSMPQQSFVPTAPPSQQPFMPGATVPQQNFMSGNPPPVQQSFVPAPPTQQSFVPASPAQQSFVPASPAQQSFAPVPVAAPAPGTMPHVYNPVAPSIGHQQVGSPVKAISNPKKEETPPHDISALNADTSNVSPQFKPIITHLKTIFTKLETAVKTAPSQKRIVADASKRIGLLFWDLNKGKVKDSVAQKVLQYAQALVAGDMQTASRVLEDLTETAWDEASSHWLSSFKRLIKLAQTLK